MLDLNYVVAFGRSEGDANNHYYPVLYFVRTTVPIYGAIELAAVRIDTMERR